MTSSALAEFDVSEEQEATMQLVPFQFVFGEALSTHRSASALSVVGMHAYIYKYANFPANFDALVNPLRTHPTIHALVLLFDSLDRLRKSMKPFAHLFSPSTGAIDLVLSYSEGKKEGRAVGVDLVTLEPNGA